MEKIVILDYCSGKVFVIKDCPMFYNERNFELGLVLDYISEEHEIYLVEKHVHFMITDSLAINVL